MSNYNMRIRFLFFFFLAIVMGHVNAQQDTLPKPVISDTLHKDSVTVTHLPSIKKDSTIQLKTDTSKKVNPARRAALLSTILPGAGQAYNKKYWKMPIVYGALGTTAYIFFRNIKQFKEANAAFKNASDNDTSNDKLIPEPYYSVRNSPDRIKSFRNEVRQNVDYSVLFFLLFWGLNVVDATVDAHLKTFDVSDELSLQIKPGYSPMAHTNGISLVLNIGKTRTK